MTEVFKAFQKVIVSYEKMDDILKTKIPEDREAHIKLCARRFASLVNSYQVFDLSKQNIMRLIETQINHKPMDDNAFLVACVRINKYKNEKENELDNHN